MNDKKLIWRFKVNLALFSRFKDKLIHHVQFIGNNGVLEYLSVGVI
jgi:hypothetical protein